jgi:hypothetical protein
LANTRLLAHDPGGSGLETLCKRAELSKGVYPAIKAAVSVISETDFDGLDGDAERHNRHIIERVLTQYAMLGVEFEHEDLEYLLSKLNHMPGPEVRVH